MWRASGLLGVILPRGADGASFGFLHPSWRGAASVPWPWAYGPLAEFWPASDGPRGVGRTQVN